MLRNLFKATFRNIFRHKVYSFINVFSLTVGLSASIFIYLWILDEVSFDKVHNNDKNLYKVLINNTLPDGSIQTYDATPARLKKELLAEIPEIIQASQNNFGSKSLIQFNDKIFNEDGLYSDAELFSIFSFPILYGDKSTPLPDLSSIAISENLATKLFGEQVAIGQILQVDQNKTFKVTAVFKNIPVNSSLQFEYVLPFDVYYQENSWMQNWWTGGTTTFLILDPQASLTSVNQKLEDFILSRCETCTTNPFLFSFSKLYLNGNFENGKNAGGRIEQLVLFGVVAAIILIMACINFMNLATARSATRSKEVGVRKIVGANQSNLIAYFILEALLMSFTALFLSMVLVQLFLPVFNEITSKSISLDLTEPTFLLGTIIIALLAGLLAGIYPSIVLSSFKPLSVLRGNVHSMLSGSGLRKTLVVIQFSAAVVLIISSITVYQQINYIINKDLGFNKDQVIVIDQNADLRQNSTAFKNDMMKLTSVEGVGFGGSNVLIIPITTPEVEWPRMSAQNSVQFKLFRCDEGFVPALDIEILRGRNFSADHQDSANYIINQKALEIMGISEEDVIGTELTVWGRSGRIIGVAKDFHNNNLRVGIEPLIFLYSQDIGFHYFVKVSQHALRQSAMADIENVFIAHSPDHPFEHRFLDDMFARQYRSDFVLAKLSLSFTVIAILISCLGLFGLATFTAERRVKELGIRKILGASMTNLTLMLCSDFARLVLLSFLIGCPLAWYVVHRYLLDFAFHVELSWWIFIIAAVGLLLSALLTVGFQSLRAALANPVDSLRNE